MAEWGLGRSMRSSLMFGGGISSRGGSGGGSKGSRSKPFPQAKQATNHVHAAATQRNKSLEITQTKTRTHHNQNPHITKTNPHT